MDKPSAFKQIFDSLSPYAAPIFGTFIALARFCRSYTKAIDEKFNAIQLDVAVLKTNHDNQSEQIKSLSTTIDKIAHDISTIKGQKEGVSNAVLEEAKEIREEFMRYLNTKSSEYDRKFAIIFNRQKRQLK